MTIYYVTEEIYKNNNIFLYDSGIYDTKNKALDAIMCSIEKLIDLNETQIEIIDNQYIVPETETNYPTVYTIIEYDLNAPLY